jgi:hypothetical protein
VPVFEPIQLCIQLTGRGERLLGGALFASPVAPFSLAMPSESSFTAEESTIRAKPKSQIFGAVYEEQVNPVTSYTQEARHTLREQSSFNNIFAGF